MVRKGNGIYSPYLRLGLIKGPDDLSPIPCRLHLVVSGTPPTILVPETVVRCCRHGHFGERSRDSLCLLREGGGVPQYMIFFRQAGEEPEKNFAFTAAKKAPFVAFVFRKAKSCLILLDIICMWCLRNWGLHSKKLKKFKTQK